MHLSDEQIIAPSISDQDHLNDCRLCHSKEEQFSQFKSKLKQLDEINDDIALPSWASIETNYAMQVQKVKTQRWKVVSMALAATWIFSCCAFLFQMNQKAISELDLLEKENEQLQLLVSSQPDPETLSQQVEYKQFEIELYEIDRLAQAAYYEFASEEEKISLWTKRKMILKKMLNRKKVKQLLTI